MYTSTLAELCDGESAVVLSVNNGTDMKRRLMDLGLIRGTKVVSLFRSPSGDPAAYLIRGAVIALRKKDAQMIIVSK